MRNIKNVTRDIRIFTDQLDYEISCLNRPVSALSVESFSTISSAYISEEGLISWVKEKLKAIGRRAVILVNSVIAKFSRNKETLEKNIAIYKANPKANVKLAISPKTMKKALVLLSVVAAAAAAIVVGVKMKENTKRKELDRRINEIEVEGHQVIDLLTRDMTNRYTYNTNQAIAMSQQAIQQQAAIANSFNQIKAELNKGAEATEAAISARNKAMAEANKLADVVSSVGHKVSSTPKDVIDEVVAGGAGDANIKAYKSKVLLELSSLQEPAINDGITKLETVAARNNLKVDAGAAIHKVVMNTMSKYNVTTQSYAKELNKALTRKEVDAVKEKMHAITTRAEKDIRNAIDDYIVSYYNSSLSDFQKTRDKRHDYINHLAAKIETWVDHFAYANANSGDEIGKNLSPRYERKLDAIAKPAINTIKSIVKQLPNCKTIEELDKAAEHAANVYAEAEKQEREIDRDFWTHVETAGKKHDRLNGIPPTRNPDNKKINGAVTADVKAYKIKVMEELSASTHKVFKDGAKRLQQIDPNGDAEREVTQIIGNISDDVKGPYVTKLTALGEKLHDASDKATIDKIKNEMLPLVNASAEIMRKAVDDYIKTKTQNK